MAQIIGYKRSIEKTVYEVVCQGCGAIIRFDENEVNHHCERNEYGYTTATCPSCQSKLTFYKQDTQKKILGKYPKAPAED